jgi:hypothetical protein
MKTLTPEEIANLTDEQAGLIAASFGHFLTQNTDFYAFESQLEYDKGSVLIALIHLLRKNRHNNEVFENLLRSIVMLHTNFIMDRERYEALVASMHKVNNFVSEALKASTKQKE